MDNFTFTKKSPEFLRIRNDTNETYTLLAVCGLTPQSGDGFEAIQQQNRWLEDGSLMRFFHTMIYAFWFLERVKIEIVGES